MASRVIEAKAVISAQDRTGGVLRAIGDRIRALGRLASATSARVAVASAASGRGRAAVAAGAIAAHRRAGAAGGGLPLGIAGRGLAAGGAALAAGKAITTFADDERSLTRVGNIVNATREQMRDVMGDAYKLALATAQPFGKIVQGMEQLASQGRSLSEIKDFLPSVAKSAQAAGAEIEDIAKSADAVGTHLKVPAKEMQLAFDTMAAAGQAGQFELKDMAKYLPSILPAAKALGFEGVEGLRNITSMMQIIRKGSGTSEEAASSMQNIFAKMESQETAKKFKKMGVDLEGAMAKARKEGRNLLEVFEEMTAKALKGDLSKIPQLFEDMQFARGMRAIMSMRGEAQKLAAQIAQTAPGTTDRNLQNVLADTKARIDRMGQSARRASNEVGALLSLVATPVMDQVAQRTAEAREIIQGAPKRVEDAKSIPEGKRNEFIARKLNSLFGIRGPLEAEHDSWAARDNLARQMRATNPWRYAGGTSFGGLAFGPGGISSGYRETPWGWNKGINPAIPHPPARPESLGRAPEVSGIEAAIRSVITGANVEAKLTGSASVEGSTKVEVTVKVDPSGITQAVANAVAPLKGALRAIGSNGPGGRGTSSPDAAAGAPGAAP
jgi:TP901 family phage tail tape measure protein